MCQESAIKLSGPLVLVTDCLVMSAWDCSGSDLLPAATQDVALDAAVDADVATLQDAHPDRAFDVTVETEILDQDWGDCEAGGAPGCPSPENDDCFSGWCVTTGDGDVCTSICESECPAGFSCRAAESTGTDVTFICLPLYKNLRRPCETGEDCHQPGDRGGTWIPRDDGSALCGGFCDSGGAGGTGVNGNIQNVSGGSGGSGGTGGTGGKGIFAFGGGGSGVDGYGDGAKGAPAAGYNPGENGALILCQE